MDLENEDIVCISCHRFVAFVAAPSSFLEQGSKVSLAGVALTKRRRSKTTLPGSESKYGTFTSMSCPQLSVRR